MGRRKGERIAKIVIKSHAFLLGKSLQILEGNFNSDVFSKKYDTRVDYRLSIFNLTLNCSTYNKILHLNCVCKQFNKSPPQPKCLSNLHLICTKNCKFGIKSGPFFALVLNLLTKIVLNSTIRRSSF